MFKIIKNAALPVYKYLSTYPFHFLDVGEGFDAPDNLGYTQKGFSRRKTSIKNGVARFRKTVNPNAKFVIGPSPAAPADTFRCVRIR
jgi:hypothetical protein